MPSPTPPQRTAVRRVWTAAAATVLLPLAVVAAVTVYLGAGRTDQTGRPSAPYTGQHLDTNGHFLLAAAVVLAAALAGGRLAERLGQPRVVGEISAGLALGPSLLGHLAPEATRWLFPTGAVQLLNGLAQLGLVLFMFGVGQELAGLRLRGAAVQAVVISQASMLVPFAIGSLGALLLLGYTGPGGHPLSFVLFVGCALSITAFPVLARILADLGLTRSGPGRLSLFAAAVGDGGSWLVLAAILAGAHGSRPTGVLLAVLEAAAVAALFLGPVRRALRRWSDTGRAERRSAGTLTTLLAIGITAAAVLTAAIGIHQLIGAFLVGLVWPSRSGRTAAVAERLTETARTVLLPFFFFGFGLTIDLGALHWDTRTVAVLLGLLTLAVLGKLVGPGLCARLTGLPWRSAVTLGILLNARGLTELVVIQIGYQAGIIDQRLLGILTIVALVTTAMTSPLIRLLTRLTPEPAGTPAAPRPGLTHQADTEADERKSVFS